MVTSITAVGLAWKLMYNKNFGIINYLLSFFGVDPIPWLEKAAYSIPALVIFGIWNILPFTIILLLSGLQNIDPQYYTAARVDGSKSLRIFFRITVPLLAPTIFLVCIVNTISCFKVFSELYPLFNEMCIRDRWYLTPPCCCQIFWKRNAFHVVKSSFPRKSNLKSEISWIISTFPNG